jgi:hypothetical protein
MKATSFNATQPQYRAGEKIVTRRGSCHIKPGEDFQAVEKMQGIKKGEHRVTLGISTCYSVNRERLDEIIHRPGGCVVCKFVLGICSPWYKGYSDPKRRGGA